MRNTCDVWHKYCQLQMDNLSDGSATVGLEHLSEEQVQKMAPQQLPKKKTAAKKTSLWKTVPRKKKSAEQEKC